jgi:hypothetical protein
MKRWNYEIRGTNPVRVFPVKVIDDIEGITHIRVIDPVGFLVFVSEPPN